MSTSPAHAAQRQLCVPPDRGSSLDDLADLRHEIRMIRTLDALKAIRGDWEALTAAAQDYSLSATYDYCELATNSVLEAGGIVAVVMVYDDHDLQAVWPLAIQRQDLLRIAKTLTCGSGEEYGAPLFKDQTNRAVVAAAVRAARKVCADLLEITGVLDGSLLQEALESAPRSWLPPVFLKRLLLSEAVYQVRLGAFQRWEDVEATLSSSQRRNLQYYGLKRLSRKGHAEWGWCTTAEDAEAVLTWLFANKRRWAESRGLRSKYLMDNKARDFFIAFARRIDLSTNPLVAFVKLDGVPVAASLNLVGPRTVEYFITTYDQAYANDSVGSMMTHFMVRWSHAHGRDFDLRSFYADYKARWANHEEIQRRHVVFLTARGRIMEILLLARLVPRAWQKMQKLIGRGLAKMQTMLGRSLAKSKREPADS